MRKIALLFVLSLPAIVITAQSPQFAVVRPDGTTYICPTLDSAYNKAVSGDNIYLPGGNYTLSYAINKKLTLFGAGFYPDSSQVTGHTILNTVYIDSGGTGGSLEGLRLEQSIAFLYSGKQINGFTIKRCYFTQLLFINSGPADSLPTNIYVTESVFSNIWSNNAKANYFSKNIIKGTTLFSPEFVLRNSVFKNNIFFNTGSIYIGSISCHFENNIFLSNVTNNICTNTYINNLLVGFSSFSNAGGCLPGTVIESSTITATSPTDIFENFVSGSPAPFGGDYHIKASSNANNAGSDGTDLGIYGSASPVSEGWIPANPHIYFKLVAPQTNGSGQLPIQFKVRTNN